MDPRALAALLSSLISQLTLLLLLLFPSSNPLSLTDSPPNSQEYLFPLIHHFLSTTEIISSLSLLSLSKKRKRTHQPQEDEPGPQLDQVNSFNSYIPQNPDSFKIFFRMNSSTFEWLSALLEPLLDCRDPVGSPLNLPAEARLGIGLFRLATGSDYPEISCRFQVTEKTAKFCIKQLCRVLCTNFRFWLGFPNPNELETVSSNFETLTGLPNCCGIIDCYRFKFLTKSNGKISSQSLAAQIVVDSNSRILSIFTGFRGNKGDSRVLKLSSLYKDIEIGNLLNLHNSPPMRIKDIAIPQYLLGDGGYPLLPWLIVPFVDPMPGSIEENFNAAHRAMRLPVLRTIASLKNWGVLSRPIDAELKTAVAYIGACSILHNALIMREDYSALCDGLGDYSLDDESSQYYGDIALEENSIEKGFEIRSALATRARDFSTVDYPKDNSN
ncbi:hypothetical protein LguiA_027385 [Lonicera macranthoides]